MTNIVSTISGQFSKSLLIGALFPVLIFLTVLQALTGPISFEDVPGLSALKDLDPQWKLVLFTLVALVLSVVLSMLNIPIIQLYEGYPWRRLRIGRAATQRQQARQAAYEARWRGMRTLLRRLIRDGERDRYNDLEPTWDRDYAETVLRAYPANELVLPTKLGNVIRSFEDYPYRQYGMESITLWPLLIAKIDKDYAGSIADAKTSFDFMINASLLSALLALASLIQMAVEPAALDQTEPWIEWLALAMLRTLGFLLLSFVFYQFAIGRALAWGRLVRGAFDLYRRPLLEQLGFKHAPTGLAEERTMWFRIYHQLTFRDLPTIPLAEYASRRVTALPATPPGEPDVADLVATRAVKLLAPTMSTVHLTIENVDERKRPASDVVVSDTIPDGYVYVWETARCEVTKASVPAGAAAVEVRSVTVSGTNPYKFEIDDLEHGDIARLTFTIMKL